MYKTITFNLIGVQKNILTSADDFLFWLLKRSQSTLSNSSNWTSIFTDFTVFVGYESTKYTLQKCLCLHDLIRFYNELHSISSIYAKDTKKSV